MRWAWCVIVVAAACSSESTRPPRRALDAAAPVVVAPPDAATRACLQDYELRAVVGDTLVMCPEDRSRGDCEAFTAKGVSTVVPVPVTFPSVTYQRDDQKLYVCAAADTCVTIASPYDDVVSVDVEPGGREFAIATARGVLEVWSVAKRRRLTREKIERVSEVRYVAGRLLTVEDGAATLWRRKGRSDLDRDAELVGTLQAAATVDTTTAALVLDGELVLFDTADGAIQRRVPWADLLGETQGDRLRSIDLFVEGTRVAVAARVLEGDAYVTRAGLRRLDGGDAIPYALPICSERAASP